MTGVDYGPLVGVANLAITTLAGVATAAIPILGYYAVQWLRSHIAHNNQQTIAVAADNANNVIHKGLAYAAATNAPDAVQGAVDYAVKQAPDVFKTLGFDTSTSAGLNAVTRMATARLEPEPLQAAKPGA